jgi:DDE superfamily endonuclease
MVQRLLDLLNQSPQGLGLAPCQDVDTLRQQLDRLQPRALNLDATEREVPRSGDQEAQAEEYSDGPPRGKARAHTSKNQVLCDDVGYGHFLSWTYEGKVHDKALADAEALCFPAGLVLRQDTGYQGYAPQGAVVVQPTKKPRKAELSSRQKLVNQSISTMRVVVEPHRRTDAIGGIKRLHCLSHGLRLRGWSIRDKLMQAGTGLHNLRVSSPFRRYGPHALTWAS